ncbi:hypothetical protein GKC34_07340, partial [Lactobacillus salivarius]|nr:hypothetical protein [Ligilactobacillus salivarius]
MSSTDTTQNSSTNNTTTQTNNLNSKVQAKLQANPSNTNITISDGDTNQVTLSHGQAQGQRVVHVTTDATSGDIFTIEVPYIFTTTNNASGDLFSAETKLTPIDDPAFISSKPLFNTTFIYHIKVTGMKDGETNTNVIFNTNFTGLHNAIIHSNPQLALNIQRYINVTTKWVDDDTGQELAPSTIQMVRSGDTYQTVAKSADLNLNYHLERIEGDQYEIAGANSLTVIYHYKTLTNDSLKEDSKPITRTINYVVDDGQVQAPDTVIQTVILTSVTSENLVTGKITWGQWSDDKWNEVLSKEVKGYHPDKKSVAQQNVTIN